MIIWRCHEIPVSFSFLKIYFILFDVYGILPACVFIYHVHTLLAEVRTKYHFL